MSVLPCFVEAQLPLTLRLPPKSTVLILEEASAEQRISSERSAVL